MGGVDVIDAVLPVKLSNVVEVFSLTNTLFLSVAISDCQDLLRGSATYELTP